MTDAMQRMGTAPLDPNALLALEQFPDCGGLALFAGAVRNHHEGKSVDRLIYSAYLPVCEKLLADIEAQAKARYGVTYVALRHRVGELAIGELAIVCVVQAPHRAEAFAACRWAVDQVKHGAPIWKKSFIPMAAVNLSKVVVCIAMQMMSMITHTNIIITKNITIKKITTRNAYERHHAQTR